MCALKPKCQGSGMIFYHTPGVESFPARRWNAQDFLDHFAGSIPGFPDIEDEGSPQERDWMP